MPSGIEAPPKRGRNAPPGRIRSASISGVLWSCAADVGRISSTNSTKSRATILSMIGPRGHRAIEMEAGVVLPDRGPGGLELPAEAAVPIPLEQIDDDRDRAAASTAAAAAWGRDVGQLRAELLLRHAHPEPFDLRQRGDRLERADGHSGLLVVVVGTEKPDAEAGQRLLELLVAAAPGAGGSRTRTSGPRRAPGRRGPSARGRARTTGAKAPDEKLSERADSGAPWRHEFD